jgi:hypothetical protein
MTTYIVTSDRLNGLKRGDMLQANDLDGVDIDHLIEAGHISPQKTTKSVKPIDTDLAKD